MSQFDRMAMQRAISEAYRTSEHHVSSAIQKLDEMIETLEVLEPTTSDQLFVAAHAVIEEFADEPSTPEWDESESESGVSDL